MVDDNTLGSRLFSIINATLLTIIALLTVLPFIHVIGSSFATGAEIAEKRFLLFPTKFTLLAYKYIFSTNTMVKAVSVSIFVTVVGTLWSMFFSVLTAYGLSRKDLVGRRAINFFIVFTMLFSGGLKIGRASCRDIVKMSDVMIFI